MRSLHPALLLSLVIALALGTSACDSATSSDESVALADGANLQTTDARAADRSEAYWSFPDTPALAEVTVMSQNLYLGGDLFQLLDPSCTSTPANPYALPICVDALYDQIVASSFPERAEQIADEIARVRPALVGLQEVSTFYVQQPADNLPGAPATDVQYDFLQLLLDALADRGLTYYAASVNQNSDVELPAFDGASIYDVRYQDADVIIALDDPDVSATPVLQESFNVLLTIPVGGISQTFVRGYQAVAATVDGFDFTFVNTHLEVGGPSGPVQEAQAAELQAVIDAIDGPVVLAGDLNSRADGSGTDSYELLTTSLEDVFDHPSLLPVPTCCQRSDLENEDSELTSRIDFVLYEGFDRVLRAETLLDEYGDRVQANGDLLWPSDHAGVAALLVYNLRRARPHS